MKFFKISRYLLIVKQVSKGLLSMKPKVAGRFFRLIKEYRGLEKEENKLNKKKNKLKDRLIKFPIKYEGLYGLQTAGNLRTTINYTSEKIEWREKPLRRALGEAFPEIVRKELVFEIMMSDENEQREFIFMLQKLFGSKKAYKKRVSESMNLIVDEERLNKMIEEKRVRLPKSAQKIIKQGFWSIRTQKVKEK